MPAKKKTHAAQGGPPLDLLLLGTPTVLVGGKEPAGDVLWRKHVALIAHLALSPNCERSRDYLMGLLWADKPQSRARHSLNEAIRRLRSGLGADRLVSRGDVIRLSDEALEVDVLKFKDLQQHDPEAALALVRGSFLEGFEVEGAPDFEDWASGWRRQLGRDTAALLLQRGEIAFAGGDFSQAQQDAELSLRSNPFSEPAVSLLMRAAALSGDTGSALAAFREFEGRMRTDLREAPGQELSALAARIREERWHPSSPDHADLDPTLVGRESVHRSAFTVVERGITAGPQCLFVVGDQGLGKSRLVQECAKRVALRGAVIATARPLASDHDAPWSTLRLLMRNALASAPGLAAADPEALSLLASLVPELARRFESTKPRDTAQVVAAIVSLIAAVAEEHPLCLVVDDAHWADGLTLTALGSAVAQLESCPAALLITVNTASEGSNSPGLVTLRSEVGRSVPGRVVSLKPLTAGEMREIVGQLAGWCSSSEEIDRLTRRIHFDTAGNPFLAVTLLQSLDRAPTLKDDLLQWPSQGATLDSPLPFSVPDLVNVAIVARVSDLDETSVGVLRAAAVGGTALDLELIKALTGLPDSELEAALDDLERRRLITYDRVRYAFTAPLFTQVVRSECLTRGQRQRLRRQAIAELQGREDLESRVLVVELRVKTDPGEAAVQEALAVAQSAVQARSVRTASRALAAAQRMIDPADRRSRSQVRSLRKELDEAL
ncbi:MAG: AAA family ATPase [Gemmatimonadota bacterium]|nr:MAG: AAA family ATPase [Gemmatimonadota bacterium]